jgi:hypothetical protein
VCLLPQRAGSQRGLPGQGQPGLEATGWGPELPDRRPPVPLHAPPEPTTLPGADPGVLPAGRDAGGGHTPALLDSSSCSRLDRVARRSEASKDAETISSWPCADRSARPSCPGPTGRSPPRWSAASPAPARDPGRVVRQPGVTGNHGDPRSALRPCLRRPRPRSVLCHTRTWPSAGGPRAFRPRQATTATGGEICAARRR